MTVDLLSLSEQVGTALTARGQTVCAAESCTGGLALSALTDRAGSSAYVLGGFVAYSNRAKMQFLGVREATILAHGSVSAAVAGEMAAGAQARFDSDYAFSITGIAGPGGATPDKPLGLTFVGLVARGGAASVERHIWDGDRLRNKQLSAMAALRMLLGALDD